EVLVTYVAFAAILAIFVAMLARSDSRLLVVAAPVSAYLFYLDQSESFLAGITLSEAMAVLGIVASIVFLTARSLSRAWFLLVLLGRPFSLKETPSVVEARDLGAAVLLLFLALVLVSFRRRELSPWVFVGVSGLAGATLIALGRAEHRFKEGEPIVQALVSHYLLAVAPL